jgi:hypothetical protein
MPTSPFTAGAALSVEPAPAPALLGVNRELGQNPELFSLDASWTDLQHCKGQLCRASQAWTTSLVAHKISQGQTPEQLTAECWASAFWGIGSAISQPLWTAARRSCASVGGLDSALLSHALRAASARYHSASLDWTPPTDMALRGWGKGASDDRIQADSRKRFAKIALALELIAELGPDAFALRLALRDPVLLSHPALSGASESLVGNLSLTYALRAFSAAGARAQAWEGSTPELALSFCAQSCTHRHLCRAASLFSTNPADKARLIGSALRLAAQTCISFLPPALAPGQEEAGEAALHTLASTQALVESYGKPSEPEESSQAFFEAWLGAAQGTELFEPHARLALGLMRPAPASLLSVALIVGSRLAQSGVQIVARPDLLGAIWSAHAHRQKKTSAGSYAARHLRLCSIFPDAAGQELSRSRASAASLAHMESGEIGLMLDEAIAEASDPSDADDVELGEPQKEPRSRPRL